MQNNKGKTTSATMKKPWTSPSKAAQKREEQRKKLLEMKRKQKSAMKQNGTSEHEVVNDDDKKENGIDLVLQKWKFDYSDMKSTITLICYRS